MLTEKVNSAITDQMIRELRSRLQIGDLVQVLKWDGWKGQKRDEGCGQKSCVSDCWYLTTSDYSPGHEKVSGKFYIC